MGWINSITRGAFGIRADISGAPAPWDDYWYSPLGTSSASGMRVNADSVMRIAAVQACVSIIARNIAMMPCKIYTENSAGSKKIVAHHPIYSRPNNSQTAFEFKQMMEAHVELRGNAYAEIVPGRRGAIDQLIPMHPDRVHVEMMKPSGRLRYVYNDPLTAQTRNLMQEEVFHLRNFSDNGMTGQSTIAMNVDTFGVALAEQDYVARFLKNDSTPHLAMEGLNFKTREDENLYRAKWQAGQTGEKRHQVAILPPGVSIKAIGINPHDAQLLDSRKFSRIQICSVFGVPPHLIGETEKTATYASVEQFNIMFAVQCILPRLVMWEQAIQRDLILDEKYFAKFSMAALLRGDTASRFAAYAVAIQTGWMCQNDVRGFEDLNPVEDGDTYWRPAAWIPLGQVSTAGQTGGTPEKNPDQPSVGDDAAGDNASTATYKTRLLALVSSAAERCVRKEVAALRKLEDRACTKTEIEQFYAAHAEFISSALHVTAAVARRFCADHLFVLLNDEQPLSVISRFEVSGARELAALAVGGLK